MAQTPQTQLRRIFDVLLADGVLRQSDTDRPVILLTPKAAAVVKQGARVEMKRPAAPAHSGKPGLAQHSDEGLYGELKRLRLRLSTRASLPPMRFSAMLRFWICAAGFRAPGKKCLGYPVSDVPSLRVLARRF